MAIDANGNKFCPQCREVKPAILFNRSRQMSDGRHGHCKACKYANRKERQRRNPEHYAQKMAEAIRRYKKKHPGLAAKRKREWIAKNPEKVAAQRKAWADKNRERVRLKIRIANARRRSNGMRYPV